MCHSRGFGVGISNYAYWTFCRCYIWHLLKSTHVYFTCGSLSIWTVFGLEILTHVNFLFSRKYSPFRDTPHSRFRCGNPSQCLPNFLKMPVLAVPLNLHTCISLLEVHRFGQCLGSRFSPIYVLFSLACFRAFSDAAHSCFLFGDPKLC